MRWETKGFTTAQRQPQDAPRRLKATKLGPTWSHHRGRGQLLQGGWARIASTLVSPILRAQGSSKATEDPPETPNQSQIETKSTPD